MGTGRTVRDGMLCRDCTGLADRGSKEQSFAGMGPGSVTRTNEWGSNRRRMTGQTGKSHEWICAGMGTGLPRWGNLDVRDGRDEGGQMESGDA